MLATAAENDRSERGQVGIGTLIVFIAMILVAALAAGALISTTDQLQEQAEATGDASTAQVANNLEVITVVGTTSADGETVDRLEITLGLGPGSGAIDLENVYIDYLGPTQDYIDVDADAIQGDRTVLETGTDRRTIVIDTPGTLEAGDDAEITVSTGDSGHVSESLTVPYTLEGDTTVAL